MTAADAKPMPATAAILGARGVAMCVAKALAESVVDRTRHPIGRDEMDFSTRFEDLEKRTSAALASVKGAATESRDQLRERIDQAQVDLDRAGKDAEQKAGEAGERAQSKWAQMKADATAKKDDVRAKIDKRNAQLDAKMAASDADWAEADAIDAIDYAEWTVENARLVALDALDARVYADERAQAAGNAP
ncbi:hypothetical protein ACXC9Q_07745 [Kribbella sp. CWNU-51]